MSLYAAPTRMSEDLTQQQMVDTPKTPHMQTPRMGHYKGVAASPAVSLKNLGRMGRAQPLLRLRAESFSSEREWSERIDEDADEPSQTAPQRPRRLEASEQQRRREGAQIKVVVEPSVEPQTHA